MQNDKDIITVDALALPLGKTPQQMTCAGRRQRSKAQEVAYTERT